VLDADAGGPEEGRLGGRDHAARRRSGQAGAEGVKAAQRPLPISQKARVDALLRAAVT